ncbi:hypothetical protein Hdeb2414_s0027g00686571 [Helianthus debilis subsp. tardiflorus]
MVWRAGLDRWPTICAFLRRNIDAPSEPLCGDLPELAEHKFVTCKFAQSKWQCVSLWCNLPSFFVFYMKDLLGLHKYSSGSETYKKALQAVYLTAIWGIWKERNKAVFNNVQAQLK